MDIPGNNYAERLQAVFDVCDTEGQGYITVDHFMNLARDHFGAENGGETLNDIVSVLDREGDGKIYFSDFCQGVKQIMDISDSESDSGPNSPITRSPLDQFTVFTLNTDDTLATVEEDANSSGTHETSELSTFNEYDMMTDDDQNAVPNGFPTPSPEADSAAQRPFCNSEDDQDSAFGGQDHRRDHDVSEEEEKFEDYGEADELESETDSQSTAKDPTRLLAGGAYEPPKKSRLRDRRESWNRLRRMQETRRFSHGHLFRAAGSSAGTSRRSSCSDEIFDDIDGNFVELNDKVKRLEAQIQMLTESQHKNDERQVRLKEENSFFVESVGWTTAKTKIHQLEETLRDVEVRAQRKLQEEQKKHRELISRTDKDKTHEVETLRIKLQQIEKEYAVLKEEAPRLRLELDRLRREHSHMEDKLSESHHQMSALMEENEELHTRIREQQSEIQQEREVNAQLLDELTKELEELRNFKVETEGRNRPTSPPFKDQKMLRKWELESQIIHLKEMNARLTDQNDDLNAQLLNRQIEEGRNLLQNGNASFADEMENLPRDELLTALKEQQEANAKLRDYMDRLMLRIMEKNPALLEIDKIEKNKRKK